jgi:hypothetical protein
MAYDNLLCPKCSCPLTASPSSTQVVCPRCSTWLDIDAKCNGVCLSCHAAKKASDNAGSCADISQGVPVSIQKSTVKNDSTDVETENKEHRSGLKALFKRVFNV